MELRGACRARYSLAVAMSGSRFLRIVVAVFCAALVSCAPTRNGASRRETGPRGREFDLAQVPTWSRDDLEFFLHGSLGTEVIPEKVLQAFRATYPEFFPDADFAAFGAIPDPSAGLPIGFSRRAVEHLGGMSAIGINCAACHVGEIQSRTGQRVRLLGVTSHLNVEALFGAVIVSTFRTADPANMEKFLGPYLQACDPGAGDDARKLLAAVLERQHAQIAATIQEDPMGAKGAGAGGFQTIASGDLRLDRARVASGDLTPTVRALLKLFHNMRAAVHVPDQPPPQPPPANGPGRNDAWGLLSYALFGVPTRPAPIKFGLVWNEDRRAWVHFDANTGSAVIRNLAASLGLGAPMVGDRGLVDFDLVKRHTALSQVIRPPRYPWAVDPDTGVGAGRGARIYAARCASCHDVPVNDQRLYSPAKIGTDPNRADIFTPQEAELFNQFFARLQVAGYQPPERPPLRSTGKYWSPDLAGVWARAPYLHNGSVRTMQELLTPPAAREKTWHRGTRLYDAEAMGYADEGSYVLDTSGSGNSNGGHDYGTELAAAEKRDLIEFLKTK